MNPGKFVRVMSTKMKKETIDAGAAEWHAHIAPFKEIGLEKAYMLVNRENGDYLSITFWETEEAQVRNAASPGQISSRDTMTKKYFEATPTPATYEIVGIVE
jgi:heme-degrading monooxygenase HmoA